MWHPSLPQLRVFQGVPVQGRHDAEQVPNQRNGRSSESSIETVNRHQPMTARYNETMLVRRLTGRVFRIGHFSLFPEEFPKMALHFASQ
jgi:hypothetical protein